MIDKASIYSAYRQIISSIRRAVRGSLRGADQPLPDAPDQPEETGTSGGQVAALDLQKGVDETAALSRAGRHHEAVEGLAGLPASDAKFILSQVLSEHLRSRSPLLFFDLFDLVVGSYGRGPTMSKLYKQAFLLPIHPVQGNKTASNREELDRLAIASRTFKSKWPGLSEDFYEALSGLDCLPDLDLVNSDTLDFLYTVNDVPFSRQEAFSAQVQWGLLANVLFSDVTSTTPQRLQKAIYDSVDSADLAREVAALGRAGRSVLMVGAHVGLFRLGLGAAQGLATGATRVGAARIKSPDDARFMSVTDSPEQAMYHLVKTLRKPGSAALIGGDGLIGQGRYRTTLLGREVVFAQGAPFVAFHAKCQPIWYMAAWENDRARLKFELGPTIAAGESYAEWLDRWFAFYTARLQDVITGDPRNMRGASGIWTLLRQGRDETDSLPDDIG